MKTPEEGNPKEHSPFRFLAPSGPPPLLSPYCEERGDMIEANSRELSIPNSQLFSAILRGCPLRGAAQRLRIIHDNGV